MGYSIEQRPCPDCGHEQHDMVMDYNDLVTTEYIEACCTDCGTTYAKPVLDPDGAFNFQPRWRR